jgi:trans-2,3-dihydro-3-hydroxyanthranilate isomerase
MQRRFVTLDVFTRKRFAGNPLAVVLDAEGLDTSAMQAIAREFNLSETVFVRPPSDPAHRAALRIFTPARELPFAGHPTVGTAVLLALGDGGQNDRLVVLEETVGPVPCRVTPGRDGGKASFSLPKLPAETGAAPPAAMLAAALGLDTADIGFAGFAPACWSAGNPFVFVPVKSRDAVARARADAAKLAAMNTTGIFIFTDEVAERGSTFHARMFAPHLGVPEDPATGSAAAAFAGLLVHGARLADGEQSVVIEQGYEMARPSLIALAMTVREGRLASATVGGDAVVVSEGTIEA